MKETMLKIRDINISIYRNVDKDEYNIRIDDSFQNEKGDTISIVLSGKTAVDLLEVIHGFDGIISREES